MCVCVCVCVSVCIDSNNSYFRHVDAGLVAGSLIQYSFQKGDGDYTIMSEKIQ